MNQVKVRFYKELNYFLPKENKNRNFNYDFKGNPSIKHLVEALGVPHTEVGQIFVNNIEVDFNYLVCDQDSIQVKPGCALRLNQIEKSGEQRSFDKLKFLLDNHLGKLAVYLRLLGFDTNYQNYYQDDELARIAQQEYRLLLTRDRGLLKRSIIEFGYCVRELDPKLQIVEVLRRYSLYEFIQPFKRCLRCNGLLESIKKEEVLDRLQPLTRIYFDEFHKCPDCNQIYWKGSHYEKMVKFLNEILKTKDY
jgi:uncharacterized protein with PIN domain